MNTALLGPNTLVKTHCSELPCQVASVFHGAKTNQVSSSLLVANFANTTSNVYTMFLERLWCRNKIDGPLFQRSVVVFGLAD